MATAGRTATPPLATRIMDKHGDLDDRETVLTDDEPTTHDPADEWADNAPRGWVRCPKCGEEWGLGDQPCDCEEKEIS